MRYFKVGLMFLCVTAVHGAHSAASYINGKVNSIAIDRAYTTDRIFIQISGDKSNTPECHTNTSWSYVLPLESDLDKTIFSMLLKAQASDDAVLLEGKSQASGHCNVHGSIETLNYIKN